MTVDRAIRVRYHGPNRHSRFRLTVPLLHLVGLDLPEANGGVRAIRRAQFVARVRDVTSNRVGAQYQPIGNSAIRHSPTDQLNDLDFAIRQPSPPCTNREKSTGDLGDWTWLARDLLQQTTSVACTQPG